MIRPFRPAAVLLSLGLSAALLGGCQGADAPTPDGGPTPGATGAAPTAAGSPFHGATPPPAATPLTTATPPTGSPAGSPPATGAPATEQPLGVVGWAPATDAPFDASDSINGLTGGTSPALVGQLFAVGSTDDDERAAAWRSTDGQSWQSLELPGGDLATAQAVTDGPAGLVAVGSSFGGEQTAPVIWHSRDGASWQAVGGSALGTGELFAVAAGPGGYLALGVDFASGAIAGWSSADGEGWSGPQPASGIEAEAAISGLAALGDRFLAYGTGVDGAAMWSSSDGAGWQPIELGEEGGDAVNDVAAGDSLMVAVGWGGDVATEALIWVSTDGRAWEPLAAAVQGALYGIAPWRDGFVAVGEVQSSESEFEAVAWTSADGRSWQRSTEDASFTQARMYDVVPATGTVVAIGERTESGRDPLYDELQPAVWVGREGER